MKTAQINGEKIVIKEVEDLTLNDKKGAIVKVLGCGLCGSDIVKFKHGISKDGTVLGHEIVAIIEEINSETSFKTCDKSTSTPFTSPATAFLAKPSLNAKAASITVEFSLTSRKLSFGNNIFIKYSFKFRSNSKQKKSLNYFFVV